MRNFISQHKTEFIHVTGYVILPPILIFLGIFLYMNHLNYTGLINHPVYGTIMKTPGILLFFYLSALLYTESHIRNQTKKFLFCLIAVLLTVFIPYQNPSSVFSNLHVLAGLCAFFFFNSILFESFLFERRKLALLFMMLVPAFLLCLFTMSINGPAEIAYVLALDLFLTAQF